MSSISGLLQNKKPLVTARIDRMVSAAVAQMTGADVGAVIVLDELGRIAGIFTERDCLQKVTRPGRDPGNTPLREVMTTSVRYAKPEQTIEECLRLMTERFFRHLPVLDAQGNILGIISIGDLVKARLSEQEFVIDQMEHYISDSLPVARQGDAITCCNTGHLGSGVWFVLGEVLGNGKTSLLRQLDARVNQERFAAGTAQVGNDASVATTRKT